MTDVSFNILTERLKLTRASNTTAYTAGDVISDVSNNQHYIINVTKANFKNEHKSGTILRATLTSSADVATAPDIELWLFSKDITRVADNGVFAPSDDEMDTFIGVIAFPTGDFVVGLTTGDGNQVCQAENLVLAANAPDGKIYGQLVVRNAYVPVSAEVFQLTLVYQQD